MTILHKLIELYSDSLAALISLFFCKIDVGFLCGELHHISNPLLQFREFKTILYL